MRITRSEVALSLYRALTHGTLRQVPLSPDHLLAIEYGVVELESDLSIIKGSLAAL